MEYIETLEKADININTSGDNTIIAAPGAAGKYLVIDHINFVVNGTVIVQFKDGATAYGGPYTLAQFQALVLENAIDNEHGVITLSDNTAFVINLNANVQVSGFIRYRIINK